MLTAAVFPRIVFIGAHVEALRPFKHLIARAQNIVGLFTLEPGKLARMSGGVDLTPLAVGSQIPVERGENVNNPGAVEWIKQKSPDVLLVVGWTQLLKPQLLEVPRIISLGFHASLLPRYRGRAPVNWAILNGESETGNTMIVLEPGADEGDIVSQRRIPITPDDDCANIYQKVSETECEMLDEVLPLIRQGRMPRTKQDSSQATVMPKRRPEDGLINWDWTSSRLYDWIRALTHPYPGAFTYLSGRKVTVWKAAIVLDPLRTPPGSVELDCEGFPLVATQSGYIKILQVECDGQPGCSGQEAGRTFLKPPATLQPSPQQGAG
jgi:methionyl-tRNA formyltransferase